MLSNWRDKIQNVQQDISSSIKALSISPEAKNTIRTKLGSKRVDINYQNCQLNAGANLLHRYQTQWKELHLKSEENAELASQVGDKINSVENELKRNNKAMADFLTQISSIPQMNKSIDTLKLDIFKLKENLEKLEDLLTDLVDKKEEEEMNRSKLDHQYQLAVYKEKRASEFETVKVKLALEHTKKVQDYEQLQQNVLKERQETFQAAFEEEINLYKTQGKIERPPNTVDSPKIEEIIVEVDEAEEAALAKFLEEEDVGKKCDENEQ